MTTCEYLMSRQFVQGGGAEGIGVPLIFCLFGGFWYEFQSPTTVLRKHPV